MSKRHTKADRRSPERKVVPLNIRVGQAEKEAFARAAEVAGVPLSAWIRERLRYAALMELDNIGESPQFVKTE